MTRRRAKDHQPREAWEPITCHACGVRIEKGDLVQWSDEQWWGHPACVQADAHTSARPLDVVVRMSDGTEYAAAFDEDEGRLI